MDSNEDEAMDEDYVALGSDLADVMNEDCDYAATETQLLSVGAYDTSSLFPANQCQQYYNIEFHSDESVAPRMNVSTGDLLLSSHETSISPFSNLHQKAGETSETNLPDVIRDSSSSSGHSQPTSPDVILDGAFQNDRKTSGDPVHQVAHIQKERNTCTLARQVPSVEPSCSYLERPSTSSAEFWSSEAGKERLRLFSSGYATQGSRQSEISFADDNVFTPPVSLKGSFVESGAKNLEALPLQNTAWLTDKAWQMIKSGFHFHDVEKELLEVSNPYASETGFPRVSGSWNEDLEMEDSSWSEDVNVDCIRYMQVAAACRDATCDIYICQLFQELQKDIMVSLQTGSLANSSTLYRLLQCIVIHSAVCSEIHCVVPWCDFFRLCEARQPEEKLAKLLSHYRSMDLGIVKIIAPTSSEIIFIKLNDNDVIWPSVEDGSSVVPTCGRDFEVMCMSGEFGQMSFYAQSTTNERKLLFIEMYAALDGVHAWKRLQGLRHRSIVEHLWVYSNGVQVVTCSDAQTYCDKSLKDVLDEYKNGLPMAEVEPLMASMLSALDYLNRSHIFYLKWTDSVGFMPDKKTVRLRDFSCAVDETRVSGDEDLVAVVRSALPPTIIPPEMFENDAGKHSEVWGIGCLLFHLTTGFPFNRRLMHRAPDDIRNKVKQIEVAMKNLPISNVKVNNILSRVFVEKPKRLDAQRLNELLLSTW